MGRCAVHGYHATDLCDLCYPLRECPSCTAKDARIRELEGNMVANGNLSDAVVSGLQSRLALLEKVAEAARGVELLARDKRNDDVIMGAIEDLRAALSALKEGK